jgi:hypothetical protein
MNTERNRESPLYVYGIVREADAAALGPIGLEVGGKAADVFPVVEGEVGAMVSALPAKGRVLPIRKNLEAQNKVLRELTKAPGGVLPVRFGHLVPSLRDVRRILADRQVDILRELTALDGKVEMALGLSWDVDNVFAFLTSQHPDLAAMRDEMFADGREPSRDERMMLGRAFSMALDEERTRYAEQMTEALDPFVVDIREDKPRAEKQILSFALLCERDGLSRLDAQVQELAAKLPDQLVFRFTGPFAPFHFVSVELEDEASEVAS